MILLLLAAAMQREFRRALYGAREDALIDRRREPARESARKEEKTARARAGAMP